MKIERLTAFEILDSRARPTLTVVMETSNDITVRAGVPAGASTGSREAKELRDGDPARYAGQGVLRAVANVNGEIADALRGRSFDSIEELDAELIALDATSDKSRLGANSVVGVSIAAARAFAAVTGSPLWTTLSVPGVTPATPVPHFNVINGGVHALNDLDFQEFMIAPLGAPTLAEAVRCGAEVYAALRARLAHAKMSTGLGDEGGFAPEISSPEEVLTLLTKAIEDAGYQTGPGGVSLAIDPASSEFYRGSQYLVGGEKFSSDEMIERYAEIVERFPVWLIEDGLAESDWDGWERLTERLGDKVKLVGDDILCTNPAIIREAIDRRVGNAALIKVNQIGTVSETLAAMRLCHEAGWSQFVSHRSGETDDTFIADLATGAGCGQMKSGAPARGERVAKYNRLLEIEIDDHVAYARH